MPPAASTPGTRRAPRAGLTARRLKAARDTVAPLPHPHAGKKRLILRCWYSLGDIVLLTAAVRELHRAYPGMFLTDLRTPFDGLWPHNPYVTPHYAESLFRSNEIRPIYRGGKALFQS